MGCCRLMDGRHLVKSNAAFDTRAGEDDRTVRGLGSYPTRSECGDLCSMETGVRLVLSSLWVRLRLPSRLSRAHAEIPA